LGKTPIVCLPDKDVAPLTGRREKLAVARERKRSDTARLMNASLRSNNVGGMTPLEDRRFMVGFRVGGVRISP
jgi:hypothetical protein